MRITPVTGDLPVLAAAPPPPVRLAADPPPVPATAPVEQTTAPGSDADAATADHRRAPTPKTFFDPPLIAQRAVLGLPTGHLIADFARSQGITYAAASAAVDREMPRAVG